MPFGLLRDGSEKLAVGNDGRSAVAIVDCGTDVAVVDVDVIEALSLHNAEADPDCPFTGAHLINEARQAATERLASIHVCLG